jgi:hypothetical protein
MDKTNKEKAKELFYNFCKEKSCDGRVICTFCPHAEALEPLIEMAEYKDDQYNSTERDGFIDITATKLLYFMEIKGYSPTDNDWDKIRNGFLEYIKNQEQSKN